MNEEYKRLKEIAEKHFESLSNLSVKLGKAKQFFSSYKNRQGIGRSVLKELEDQFKINPQFIKFGEGNMLLTDEVTTSKGVPFYDIDISASIVTSLDDMLEVEPTFYIDYKPLNHCLAYFRVYGESMYPRYCSGDLIGITKHQNHNVIMWGEPYLVITDAYANNLRTIKLIFKHDDEQCNMKIKVGERWKTNINHSVKNSIFCCSDLLM